MAPRAVVLVPGGALVVTVSLVPSVSLVPRGRWVAVDRARGAMRAVLMAGAGAVFRLAVTRLVGMSVVPHEFPPSEEWFLLDGEQPYTPLGYDARGEDP